MKEPTFGEVLMNTIRDIARDTVPAGMLDGGEEETPDENSNSGQ